jgi:undecaprenyl-diphosphatase
MPLLVLIATILTVFFAVYCAAWRVPAHGTLALFVAVVGAVVVGILTYAVLDVSVVRHLDGRIANWAHAHATHATTQTLLDITRAGAPGTVILLTVVFAVLATAWTRSPWVLPFMACVVGGNALLTTTLKDLADRVRPAIDPTAAALGPSFPSGHSSYTAAACAAAAVVVAGRGGRRTRAVAAGAAAALAATIAATRVLLDVHWLSDVLAGLALGWAWFAVCAMAFGPRRLRFTPVVGRRARRRSTIAQRTG